MTIEEILAGESQNVEFKVQRPDKSIKYMKTVVAFANGKGGRIVFGIDDKTREVVGISEDVVFQEIDAITNAISDSCEPTIIPDVYLQNINGKPVIVAEIRAGRQKPYYIKADGLENGVYIRVSGTTRPADREMSRELYYECDGHAFDSVIRRDLKVTDEDIDTLCKQMKEVAIANSKSDLQRAAVKDVTKNVLISWGILKRSEDGNVYPTNAYVYLTGQGGFVDMDATLKQLLKAKKAMLSDNSHAKEVRTVKAELAKKKTLFSGLYQDFREGILTQDDYASTREILVRDIEKLEKQLSELTAAKKENTKQTEAEKELASLVKKYSKATEMTQELADAMIESMQLHDDNSVSITFRYMDEFKAVMESIETLRKEVA